MEKDTKVLHGYEMKDKMTGASSIPKYQVSTFHQEKILANQEFVYSRFGNPTISSVEKAVASLEDGRYGIAFSSGVAAISSVLLLLSSGDHIIMCNDIYGGTYAIVKDILEKFSIEVSFVDEEDSTAWEKEIRKNTKMIYIETPSNPLLKITDIKKVSEIAKQNNLISICDNTFMTPYFQNPLNLGIDVVIHSATKFLNGHSDVVAGLVVTNNQQLQTRIKSQQINLGGILSVEDGWLLMRGLKTLAIRMEKSEENAKKIAEYLITHPKISRVYHPSLNSHVGREIQLNQASGFGSVLSFELKNQEQVLQLFSAINYPLVAVSLGGVESILSYPWSMSHGGMPSSEKMSRGISKGLIRFSVGIENVQDLIQDLDQALKTIQ
ncbi:trans-sulfuration enzyme family protein [Enterococcus sp. AZ072]|uniref:trans-sulfuration enzyme family protein n=1 Tax=unclassified Enterococcus TaxID=2608891 RepID=UPI003D2DCDF1